MVEKVAPVFDVQERAAHASVEAAADRQQGIADDLRFQAAGGVAPAQFVVAIDRYNNRVQLFTPDGKFLREAFVAKDTTDSRGTASDVAFSPDKDQRFLYVADAANYKIRILDRATLQVLGSFGRQGYYAGQWHWLHGLATDSKGNLYTSESQGNRVQKFVVK